MNECPTRCADIPSGKFATIVRLAGTIDDNQRLREMGLYEGAVILKLSPCLICVNSSRFCLNKLTASLILVEIL